MRHDQRVGIYSHFACKTPFSLELNFVGARSHKNAPYMRNENESQPHD